LECRLRTRLGCESRRSWGRSAVSWVYAPTPRVGLLWLPNCDLVDRLVLSAT
jgi:hypothetical protein